MTARFRKAPAHVEGQVDDRPPFPFTIGESRWEKVLDTPESKWRMPGRVYFDLDCYGVILTNKENRKLLLMTQRYLQSVWYSHQPYSVSEQWHQIKPFLAFVIKNRNVKSFSQVWGVDDFIAYLKKMKGEEVGPHGLNVCLLAVKRLWAFSKDLEDGLHDEPWAERSSSNVAGIKARVENARKPFAMDEFAQMLKTAFDDLGGVDEFCLELSALEEIPDNHVWSLRIARFRTAAAVVVYGFVGLRPSELVSLAAGCLRSGALRTARGELSVTWLHGRIFKDKPPGGEPHRWIASDEVVRAISALEKLKSALLEFMKRGIGFSSTMREALTQSKGLIFFRMEQPGKLSQISPSAVESWLQVFAQRPEVKSVLRSARITQSRFRPTVARAAAALKVGDLAYFRAHYGHVNSSTTMGYFETFADDLFKKWVNEEVTSRMQDVFHSILSSDGPLLGRRGEQLEPLRRQYAVMTFVDKKALVSHCVAGHQLKVGPQSYCIAPKTEKLCPPGCMYDETECTGCNNGVITEAHAPMWDDIGRRTEALTGEFPLGSPAYEAWAENLRIVEGVRKNLRKKEASN